MRQLDVQLFGSKVKLNHLIQPLQSFIIFFVLMCSDRWWSYFFPALHNFFKHDHCVDSPHSGLEIGYGECSVVWCGGKKYHNTPENKPENKPIYGWAVTELKEPQVNAWVKATCRPKHHGSMCQGWAKQLLLSGLNYPEMHVPTAIWEPVNLAL